jgi:hypothetical protein
LRRRISTAVAASIGEYRDLPKDGNVPRLRINR